jgi:ankyrin repeat protein
MSDAMRAANATNAVNTLLALLLAAGGPAAGPATAADSPAAAGGPASPLADAAERMDGAAVRALLEEGADRNAAQVDGMTALHWAAHRDDLETARLLVDAGAGVNAANRYGVRPLSLAAVNGSAAIVGLLLEAGADPNATLRGGETALMTAARTGRVEPVKALLARGAGVNARDRREQTAIMWAAADGHARVVELLIEAGADFRTPLSSGFTPLLFAVREGRRDAARALLAAGADVNAVMEPRRPFTRAPRKGTSALMLAVENAHFELALELIERGADPNDQRSGFTPLHALSWVRKPGCGDEEDGDPPPVGSGSLGSLQFARELVARGADVNARLERGASARGRLGRKGGTPFFLACITADLPLMRLLVELGADPLLPNADGSTPLMAATGVGTVAPGEDAGTEPEVLEAARFALDLGADVNAVDENGETAMHGAAYKNVPSVVELLGARGAKIEAWNQKNRWGWTPLSIAEGYRVGNFKPSPETVAALHRVMLAAGVTPPPPSRPREKDRETY